MSDPTVDASPEVLRMPGRLRDCQHPTKASPVAADASARRPFAYADAYAAAGDASADTSPAAADASRHRPHVAHTHPNPPRPTGHGYPTPKAADAATSAATWPTTPPSWEPGDPMFENPRERFTILFRTGETPPGVSSPRDMIEVLDPEPWQRHLIAASDRWCIECGVGWGRRAVLVGGAERDPGACWVCGKKGASGRLAAWVDVEPTGLDALMIDEMRAAE